MGAWVDEWMDVCTDRQMDGWIDGQLDGWIDGQLDGWMDGWMDEWMDGLMDVMQKLCHLYLQPNNISNSINHRVFNLIGLT